jgi:hypothetical protein
MVRAAPLFGLALAIALTVACDSFIGHEVIRFFGSRKARRGVDSADPVRQVTAISAMFDSKKKPRMARQLCPSKALSPIVGIISYRANGKLNLLLSPVAGKVLSPAID